jgi:hypothetical protein
MATPAVSETATPASSRVWRLRLIDAELIEAAGHGRVNFTTPCPRD